jgi:hypothetical protein
MRRSASEIIKDLEQRIARLESKTASNRTASSKIKVSISTGSPRNEVERMTVQELLSMVKSQATGRCVVNIIPNGERSKINFICPDNHWSCNVSLFDFALAVEASHPVEMDDIYMNAGIHDLEDRFEGDVDIAYAIKDYLQTSRGSFGGGLGRGWMIEVI